MTNKPLTVYKASAGSGKTFTLAAEYIKLLVRNPYCYRNILAVTFTNKATEEMKMRILSQLYGIWNQLPDSKDYTDKICRELDVTAEQVSQKAGVALHELLHHYNDFRIETIDSFFQSVLRNLARELDLTQNLRIELNDKQIEEEAVDKMIEQLNPRSEVLMWILNFINKNIEDDKSWNVIGQIKEFGMNIFKEFYKRESKELTAFIKNKERIETFEKQMMAYSNDAQKQIEEYADKFFTILANNNLTINDLSRKESGPAGAFVKIKNGDLQANIFNSYFQNAMNNPEQWTTKKSQRYDDIVSIAQEQFLPLQQELFANYNTLYSKYASARLTIKLITQLRLLSCIEKNIREMNEEANRFLLSDTQQLLSSLIDDSDSPFIFEKIGTRLEHIMIDEFQDTSTIQWQNFKTLLLECISHEESNNLIVGDVKQSIYRWRAGDWRLLNNIDKQFDNRLLNITSLGTNYRSECNVIAFNNTFFTTATDILTKKIEDMGYSSYAAELRQAYSDVIQNVPERKKSSRGQVSVKLLEKSKDNESGNDYYEATMEEVAQTIYMLMERGINQSKIAILVRQNKYIPMIANYFLNNHKNINLVSDEAFQLRTSIAVNIIINALRVVTDVSDEISWAALVKLYNIYILENKDKSDGELLLKDTDKNSLLPIPFVDNIPTLQTLPLHELVETIYDIFSLEQLAEQSAYISTFYDHLSRFASDTANDTNKFLREWDDRLCTKTIKSTDIEGVRILSIHASKGLEYDNVIIPFCDWQLEISGDTLWCTPEEEPYNELPLVPVKSYAKQVDGTIYKDDYMNEHLQNIVDNLNLLYVAFTRASANLFIIGQTGQSENYRSQLIEECLNNIIAKGMTQDNMPEKIEIADNVTATDFTFGELYVPTEKAKKHTENVLLQPSKPQPINIISHKTVADFRQSNASIKFIENSDDDGMNAPTSYLKIGSILHEIFSRIRTKADIDGILAQMQSDGVLYDDDATNEKITGLLHKRLNDERIALWFSDKWTLLNECTILKWDAQNNKLIDRRPDRVMTDGKETIVVDFKFGTPKDEHIQQVMEYMELLTEMRCPDVKGYLWYVYINKIQEVKRV